MTAVAQSPAAAACDRDAGSAVARERHAVGSGLQLDEARAIRYKSRNTDMCRARERMSAFPTILIAARERAGITQAGLAERIGVSAATMASWETGRRRPGASARQQVIEAADWLRIEAADLNLMLEDLGFSPVAAGRIVPLLDRRKTLGVALARVVDREK